MQAESSPYPRSTRAWLTVAILMLLYVLSFIDRQILTLMVDPIRHDLQLSEVQVSLLMGFSFALFYALCGLPMGYLADKLPRNRLILAGLLVWTTMTAVGGLARNYWVLFVSRLGVGVGESVLSPAAYSLIADSFPPERRSTAISFYTAGASIGLGLALLLGGLAIEWARQFDNVSFPLLGVLHSWQIVLLLAGGAGFVIAPVMFFVREPGHLMAAEGRTAAAHARAGSPAAPGELKRWLLAHRYAYLGHNVGYGLLAMVATAVAIWAPAYFSRVHGMSPGAIGLKFGLMIAIGGTLAVISGGLFSDLLRRKGVGASNLVVGVLGAVLPMPVLLFGLSSGNADVAVLSMMPAFFLLSLPFGAAPAAIQEMTPRRLRGQASALYLLSTSVFSYGIGPTVVAMLTQYVFGNDAAVGRSLIWLSMIGLVLAAAVLLAGIKPYRRALTAAQQL